MVQDTQQLFREREQRVIDAVQLKVPDRVPVSISFSYFPARFAGVTTRDAFYDLKKWGPACIKTALYFQPDRCGLTTNQSGWVLETLDHKQLLWPGHGVSDQHCHQFVEGEYMKADEYDLFLQDMSDFLLRYYLPRVYGVLEPLSQLRPFNSNLGGLPLATLATPEWAALFEKLSKAARYAVEWQSGVNALIEELHGLGFPVRSGATTGGGSPFDGISDFLRGMCGTMLDMYRQPDKLIAAVEKLAQIQVQRIKTGPKAKGFTLVFVALHRGADGFMSKKQFETFYWPFLKENLIALVEAGYTPNVFFEGDYTSRLEYLLELPKGKVLGLFDCSDMTRVKEVLGGHMCIAGNVPSSLLQTGSTQEVRDYCKWLIDVVGKDGGYIMAPRSSIDEVKPENLKAMIDFTKEYGKYR